MNSNQSIIEDSLLAFLGCCDRPMTTQEISICTAFTQPQVRSGMGRLVKAHRAASKEYRGMNAWVMVK